MLRPSLGGAARRKAPPTARRPNVAASSVGPARHRRARHGLQLVELGAGVGPPTITYELRTEPAEHALVAVLDGELPAVLADQRYRLVRGAFLWVPPAAMLHARGPSGGRLAVLRLSRDAALAALCWRVADGDWLALDDAGPTACDVPLFAQCYDSEVVARLLEAAAADGTVDASVSDVQLSAARRDALAAATLEAHRELAARVRRLCARGVATQLDLYRRVDRARRLPIR
jgi:hypothetical protein